MSDLQCPAKFVIVTPGADEQALRDVATRDYRFAGLWIATPTDQATRLAADFGLAPRLDVRLGPDSEQPRSFVAAIYEIADLTRGETTLVLSAAETVASAVAAECRNPCAGAADRFEVVVDSSGWWCTPA